MKKLALLSLFVTAGSVYASDPSSPRITLRPEMTLERAEKVDTGIQALLSDSSPASARLKEQAIWSIHNLTRVNDTQVEGYMRTKGVGPTQDFLGILTFRMARHSDNNKTQRNAPIEWYPFLVNDNGDLINQVIEG